MRATIWFKVERLNAERLLAEWRWLYRGQGKIVARTAFGDLFIEDNAGEILRLDVSIGKLEKVAESESVFRKLSAKRDNEWFCAQDESAFAARGFVPSEFQCIGFNIPLVFKADARKPYIADLYECVSFLGDLNQQISTLPDGQQVKLVVGPRPQK